MDDRLKVHELLLTMGTTNVYYKQPINTAIIYPAIMYSKSGIENTHANDSVYNQSNRYTVTVISKNVDDIIVANISKLPKCRFDRQFVADGLYHDVFNLYY